MDCYAFAQVIGGGPKIFRPTARQLFALENMKLNLTVAEFQMPFPTIVIELPDEYREKRNPEAHCLILHRDPITDMFVHVVMYVDTAYKSWWPAQRDQEVEHWLGANDIRVDYGDISVTQDEATQEFIFRRAALNYCLLLDEVGIKKEGPACPSEYAQLVKWCQKKTKHTAKNKVQLQAQPIVYGLEKQPTDLIRIVGSVDQLPAAETGRIVSPHSRRGYYRMQPHGPGSTLRKRIRIPATIVNKHLLLEGPPGATYKT
jgi:hypothetical protein